MTYEEIASKKDAIKKEMASTFGEIRPELIEQYAKFSVMENIVGVCDLLYRSAPRSMSKDKCINHFKMCLRTLYSLLPLKKPLYDKWLAFFEAKDAFLSVDEYATSLSTFLGEISKGGEK